MEERITMKLSRLGEALNAYLMLAPVCSERELSLERTNAEEELFQFFVSVVGRHVVDAREIAMAMMDEMVTS